MDAGQKEVVKSIIQVAWADGQVSAQERDVLSRMLMQVGCSPEEVSELDEVLSGTETRMPDLDKVLPDKASRLDAMRAIMTMSFADGALSFKEFTYMERMASKLGVDDDELEQLRAEVVAAQG